MYSYLGKTAISAFSIDCFPITLKEVVEEMLWSQLFAYPASGGNGDMYSAGESSGNDWPAWVINTVLGSPGKAGFLVGVDCFLLELRDPIEFGDKKIIKKWKTRVIFLLLPLVLKAWYFRFFSLSGSLSDSELSPYVRGGIGRSSSASSISSVR